MANTLQTTQRVTFTSIATIIIPIGVGSVMAGNTWFGLLTIVIGIGALIAREYFKSV